MRTINQPDSTQVINSRTGVSVRRVHVSRVSVFTSIPYIRLKGNWLSQAGFSPHDEIEVRVHDKCLVIYRLGPSEISKRHHLAVDAALSHSVDYSSEIPRDKFAASFGS